MRKCLIYVLFLVAGERSPAQMPSGDWGSVNSGADGGFSFSTGTSSGIAELRQLTASRTTGRVTLGFTKNRQPVNAYFFPGRSEKRALVLGGMHGSELSSIEVAREVMKSIISGTMPEYNVVVIPTLFPDNAIYALSPEKGAVNKGRYTDASNADPNRQMPPLGKAFDKSSPTDLYGRTIEKENQMLLELIQEFAPERIVNLHAIRDITKAGIYADPRTDCEGYALGFESDSLLAVMMAKQIAEAGGPVPGNRLDTQPTAVYHCDPVVVPAGSFQKRNLHGSKLPNNRGYGVSLGSWATTAVCEEGKQRDAIQLLTVEFPGYKNSSAYQGKERENRLMNVRLYANAIVKVFLGSGN